MNQRKPNNLYMSNYLAKKYAKRRAECLALLGGKCSMCGAVENLEFDHVEPKSKLKSIADCLIGDYLFLLMELKKCQLLCAECHKEKTLLDKGQLSARGTHGTVSSFR